MGFSVSCAELPRLMRQLRDVDPQLAKDAKKKIREAQQPAMALVRASAKSFEMDKAAGAVQPANRYTGAGASLAIKVNATLAPNARPLAHPNERGTFNRHPVFGQGPRTGWHWTEQPARKFFDPAADAGFKLCENKMADALDEIVSWLGR
jgi:hypothetical protein